MPQNLKQALLLFQTAAQNGHAKSMNILARFLEEGWEIPQDRQAALAWYKRSAEGGDYRGQHNYATALAEAGKPKRRFCGGRKRSRTLPPIFFWP